MTDYRSEPVKRPLRILAPAILLGILPGCGGPLNAQAIPPTTEAVAKPGPARVRSIRLGDTRNVHRSGDLYLSGQFGQADLEAIRSAGIRRIITLRTPAEVDWDERAAVEAAGMEFVEIPFRQPTELTDEVFNQVREVLRDDTGPTLLHCASANRVGAVWLSWRILDEGVPFATALAEARQVGLRSDPLVRQAQRYLRRIQSARDLTVPSEATVDPGLPDSGSAEMRETAKSGSQPASGARPELNERYVDRDLDVDDFIARFEIESREVYAARNDVVAACRIEPGQRVADVGAGTGLYSRLFAEAVGNHGWVYAVDIAPRFLEHIRETSQQAGRVNLTPVLGSQTSIQLPPDSVDLVFLCDTYHHFEDPPAMIESIRRALKPGGHLVLIDFERIPGVTREFLMSHVRAGKPVFRSEIEAGGLELVEQVEVPGFAENYFLRFRKPE